MSKRGDLIFNYVYYSTLGFKGGIIIEKLKPIFVGHNLEQLAKLFFAGISVYTYYQAHDITENSIVKAYS